MKRNCQSKECPVFSRREGEEVWDVLPLSLHRLAAARLGSACIGRRRESSLLAQLCGKATCCGQESSSHRTSSVHLLECICKTCFATSAYLTIQPFGGVEVVVHWNSSWDRHQKLWHPHPTTYSAPFGNASMLNVCVDAGRLLTGACCFRKAKPEGINESPLCRP